MSNFISNNLGSQQMIKKRIKGNLKLKTENQKHELLNNLVKKASTKQEESSPKRNSPQLEQKSLQRPLTGNDSISYAYKWSYSNLKKLHDCIRQRRREELDKHFSTGYHGQSRHYRHLKESKIANTDINLTKDRENMANKS